jgi:hypothetical protein
MKAERFVVTVAEEFADGSADVSRWEAAMAATYRRRNYGSSAGRRLASWPTMPRPTWFWRVHLHDAAEAASYVAGAALKTPGSGPDMEDAIVMEQREQAALLRDLVGNPFRPPLLLAPTVLAWHNHLVVQLATAAYDERLLPSGVLDSERLTVLGDALSDAGCTDAELLEHLREPGPHVRGCWALDKLLGRD